MRHIDVAGSIIEVVAIVISCRFHAFAECAIRTMRVTRDELVEIIGLRNNTHIEEGVQTDKEMLAFDIEIDYSESEFDIRKRKTIC